MMHSERAAGMMLTCVRHGRTGWNAAGRFQGHTDVPLDATGRAQAAAVALHLRDDAFDFAVSSDLVRASQTARLVLQDRAVPLTVDQRWREMSFGAWEGLAWAEIESRFPDRAGADLTVRSIVAPGGESFEHLCTRVGAAVDALRSSASSGASVLVVTHAGPIHALLAVLDCASGADALGLKLMPASISRFVERDGRWTIRELNTVAAPMVEPAGVPEGCP